MKGKLITPLNTAISIIFIGSCFIYYKHGYKFTSKEKYTYPNNDSAIDIIPINAQIAPNPCPEDYKEILMCLKHLSQQNDALLKQNKLLFQWLQEQQDKQKKLEDTQSEQCKTNEGIIDNIQVLETKTQLSLDANDKVIKAILSLEEDQSEIAVATLKQETYVPDEEKSLKDSQIEGAQKLQKLFGDLLDHFPDAKEKIQNTSIMGATEDSISLQENIFEEDILS